MVTNEKIRNTIAENQKRKSVLNAEYNPLLGIGSPIERKLIEYSFRGNQYAIYLPVPMFNEPIVNALAKFGSVEKLVLAYKGSISSLDEFYSGFVHLRFKYDLEFWAISIVKIKPKTEDDIIDAQIEIPFTLNYPQRKLLKTLEEMRVAGVPIRIILVKARQWGGSTLTQVYAAWIQLEHKTGWNSSIIALLNEQSAGIRRMYERLLNSYPKEVQELTWGNFQNQQNVKFVKERDFTIAIGSMQSPDSIRSADIRIFHGSEVGLWKKTDGKSPEDLLQSIEGTLPEVPYSYSTLESTAKGVGNFFHTAYLKAVSGQSNYRLVFVAWFEIEKYTREIPIKLDNFLRSFTEYEWFLWECGATLEGIWWYRGKSKSYEDTWRMQSEFPSTPEEAFQSTGRPVFHPSYLEALKIHLNLPYTQGIIESDSPKGELALTNIRFLELSTGYMKVWTPPVPYTVDPISERYCVSMDIGGASAKADKTIITVLDRIGMLDGEGEIEVVCSIQLNIDQDVAIWIAIKVAMWYNTAMFIPESNSMDREQDTEGNHFLTILDEIVDYYPNIYMRTTPEQIKQGIPAKYGFQTTAQSKTMVIDNHKALLREFKFIERETESFAEHKTFEHKDGGRMGGAGKMHDDRVMGRAIGSWCASKHMDPPVRMKIDRDAVLKRMRKKNIVGESSI